VKEATQHLLFRRVFVAFLTLFVACRRTAQ